MKIKALLLSATFLALSAPALAQTMQGGGGGGVSLPIDLASQVTGVLPSINGGAGTVNGILQANGSGATSAVTVGSGLSFAAGTLSATGSGGNANFGTATGNTSGNAICMANTTVGIQDCGYSASAIPTNKLTNALDAQTVTSYTILSSDGGKIVSANNASAVAFTLFSGATAGSGWAADLFNKGAGALTTTLASGNFDNGATSIVTAVGQDLFAWSDGTNMHSVLSLPVMAADTLLANFTASSNYPVAATMPACASDGSHALTFASHALACTAVTGGAASLTVNSSTITSGTTGRIPYNNAGTYGEISTFTNASGALTLSTAGAASAPAFTLSGAPFAGTGTTSFPQLYLNFGTAPTNFNTAGTALGVNASTAWAGDLINLQIAGGTSSFKVSGVLATAGGLEVNSGSSGVVNGMQLKTANDPCIYSNSTCRFDVGTTNVTSTLSIASSTSTGYQLITGTPSATQPTLVPNHSATTTGVGAQAAGNLSLTASGVEIERLVSTGPQIITLPTDATHTDATLCRDTTSGAVLTGTGTIGICLGTSTARAKENIRDVTDADALLKLRPVSFNYRKGWGYPSDKQYYGFLAEDVKKVLPKLVGVNAKGETLNADYVGMIPLLVRQMQKQEAELASLRKQLASRR